MAERVYNKLVRDNIPDIIREQGETPVIRTLNDEDYRNALAEKLREEGEVFLAETILFELSDVLAVLEGMSALQGWTDGEIQKACQNKRENRGAFRERIFLEKVIENLP